MAKSRLVDLPVAFRLTHPLAQDLEQPVGHLWMLLQERLEVPLRDRRELDIGVCLDGGAATLLVEQSHLAERVARPERARLALDRVYGHGPVEDDHEAHTVVASDDDLVAGRVLNGLHLLFDGAELGLGQSLEKFRLLDVDHAQIVSLLAGLLFVQKLLETAVRVLLTAVHDLRVALQSVQVGMAEDLLDQAHVASGHLEQCRGRGVASDMR